ncbi:MAG: hypothetical protein HKN87_19155 [Saprospiraceae bacterium]|nr:hypothetical protein [Saprospiraceae bacterium]
MNNFRDHFVNAKCKHPRNLTTWWKFVLVYILVAVCTSITIAQNGRRILVIQDEVAALEPLVEYLEAEGGYIVELVDQDHLPTNLSSFESVVGFIHKTLFESTEEMIIKYTREGGRFICLHHTISSGKAKNKYFFDFLGIQLDHPEFSSQPVEPGEGYGWFHDGEKGIDWALVNLNPQHHITSHKVTWDKQVQYRSSDEPSTVGSYPSIAVKATEVYMNHKFTDGRGKTVLCGLKYRDPRNGKIFMQDRAVWLKDYGKGRIVYFMPGDRASDYANKGIAQMILNAIDFEK